MLLVFKTSALSHSATQTTPLRQTSQQQQQQTQTVRAARFELTTHAPKAWILPLNYAPN